MDSKEKKKYEKKAEKEQKQVEKMEQEYDENGYYTPIEGVGVKSKQNKETIDAKDSGYKFNASPQVLINSIKSGTLYQNSLIMF